MVQVFSRLSYSWRQAVTLRGKGTDPDSLSWPTAKEFLQAEDNARSQSDLRAPDAVFPLGHRRGGRTAKGGSRGGRYLCTPFFLFLPREEASGFYPPSGREEKGKDSAGPKGPKPIFVCYYCFGGHTVSRCPTVKEGFRPSAEQKARADKIRQDRLKNREGQLAAVQAAREAAASVAGASTAAASSSSQGESSSGTAGEDIPSC